ncbi:MAG TPA: redoxin domain-containing protein [Chryseolinea sp.]|nr:redoxin domain-containing protein [Chryseolinea sp.]
MKPILVILINCLIILLGCAGKEQQTTSNSVSTSSDQPDMSITLLDNSVRNIKDLSGKNVLVFFQPDCDHCQREADDIRTNLNAFGKCTVYFITAAPAKEISEFATTYKLSNYPNVFFAFTPAKNILDHYGPISAPSIYIYSDEHKLVKSFNGEVAINEVVKYI